MKDALHKFGIYEIGLVPLDRCKIIKEYLLTKNGLARDSLCVTMLIPYKSEALLGNLSAYASVLDYHLFVKELSQELEALMLSKFPNNKFKVFSDHSPIDEVHACCISGLGFVGDNGLIINEKYSSFVFLAEAITDIPKDSLGLEFTFTDTLKECLHCGKCAEACPCGCIKKPDGVDDFNPKSMCLSAITQKKGELSEGEKELMLTHNTVWGCDICQNVCPFTQRAQNTPIEFFKKNIITNLDSHTLDKMSEEEFDSRPFSWRGRGVVERNIKLFEEEKND